MTEYTDAQIDQFLAAAIGVQGVVETFTPQLQAAEGEDAQNALREQAQQQMAVHVENSGLSIPDYNAIAEAAQTDKALAERIEAAAVALQGQAGQ